MGKQFELVFEQSGVVLVADMLDDAAPITCEVFWDGIATEHTDAIHHGGETGPEMWCFVPPPKEELPYENSTVFPEHGDIVFYHYRQPPTRDGIMIYDIGIYWDRGQSKLKQGWIPANLFARIAGREQIALLRKEAGRLLLEGDGKITLRRKA
ncbi:MAG: DUF3830 family protein [Chloroflexi bacterium]|nr:DUF3830 family protein [Chloroflexota bacterium]